MTVCLWIYISVSMSANSSSRSSEDGRQVCKTSLLPVVPHYCALLKRAVHQPV